MFLTCRPARADRDVDLVFGLESLPALPPAYRVKEKVVTAIIQPTNSK